MKFILLTLLVSIQVAHADGLTNLLADCRSQYEATVQELKSDVLENSPWNYDNEYDYSDIKVSAPFGVSPKSFVITLHLTDEPQGRMAGGKRYYKITPIFIRGNRNKCDMISWELIREN